jgi:hypothetical protein
LSALSLSAPLCPYLLLLLNAVLCVCAVFCLFDAVAIRIVCPALLYAEVAAVFEAVYRVVGIVSDPEAITDLDNTIGFIIGEGFVVLIEADLS